MNTEREMLMAEYISETGLALEQMRLLIEGGCWLYTEEASPLLTLARAHNQHALAEIFSTLGHALYDLRTIICDLQSRYTEEIKRQSQ